MFLLRRPTEAQAAKLNPQSRSIMFTESPDLTCGVASRPRSEGAGALVSAGRRPVQTSKSSRVIKVQSNPRLGLQLGAFKQPIPSSCTLVNAEEWRRIPRANCRGEIVVEGYLAL